MKRMIVYCCVGGCENVLDVTEYDLENPGFTLYECIGDRCPKCVEEQDNPKPKIKFTPIPFGQTKVDKEEDFETMMAKRKIENRKKSGKGPGRGNR